MMRAFSASMALRVVLRGLEGLRLECGARASREATAESSML